MTDAHHRRGPPVRRLQRPIRIRSLQLADPDLEIAVHETGGGKPVIFVHSPRTGSRTTVPFGVPNRVPDSADLTPPGHAQRDLILLYSAESGVRSATRNEGVGGSSPPVGFRRGQVENSSMTSWSILREGRHSTRAADALTASMSSSPLDLALRKSSRTSAMVISSAQSTSVRETLVQGTPLTTVRSSG
jgi:hypothetical protein